MTDENGAVVNVANGVMINVTLGSGLSAEIVEVPFDSLGLESNPEDVTDRELISALNEYLGDDLDRMRMTELPSNYVVTRATQRSTGLPTFIVGAKPEYGDYPTELPENATDVEKYQPAMEIKTQDDADAYLDILVKHTARKLGCAWCDAEQLERHNIGWFAQYKDHDTFERVRNLFGTETQPALA